MLSERKFDGMKNLSIRNVDDDVVAVLKLRAAKAGVSMEEQIRRILVREARSGDSAGDIMLRIFCRSWDGTAFEVPEDDFTDPDVEFS